MSEFRHEWIAQYLHRAPKVIFDVGTYDGADAVGFKRKFPDARVDAFEADPDNHARIVESGEVAKTGVGVHHFAVCDKAGTVEFHPVTDARHKLTNDGCSGSILAPTAHVLEKYPFLKFREAQKIPAIRLDEFCAKNGIAEIDVLHIDAQGAEGYVLKGLGEMRPGMIFLEIDAVEEYVGTVPLETLHSLLTDRGYDKPWQGDHDALYVLKTNPLDRLTVCVTNFHRPQFLDRALASVRAAGIRRVVIAAIESDEAVEAVIEKYSTGWLSYIIARVDSDIGCNATWLLAAYRAGTDRILVLHDDDILCPELGKAYAEVISPAMDAGAGFASWRPRIHFEDDTTKPCDYFTGPTRTLPSTALAPVIDKCLTHSPVISILDRQTVIHACKEAEQTLTSDDSLERPGMLLGTELLVYLRHIQNFPKWLYVDQVLSMFGSHPGSGTIANMTSGKTDMMRRGYELAKAQARNTPPPPCPKIIFIYSLIDNPTPEDQARFDLARRSWDFHFGQFTMIELPVRNDELRRTSATLGDPRHAPYARDLFDLACAHAMPEDVVVYCNLDIGLTTLAPDRLLAGVSRGNGVTVCPRRRLDPKAGRFYRSVLNCKLDGGFDIMAVTPAYWQIMREQMPDMLIGREAWDTVFRTIAETWADDRKDARVSVTAAEWSTSAAYTDDVCWHKKHDSWWDTHRTTNPGQIHNRELARKFFTKQGIADLVTLNDAVKANYSKVKPKSTMPTLDEILAAGKTRDSSAPRVVTAPPNIKASQAHKNRAGPFPRPLMRRFLLVISFYDGDHDHAVELANLIHDLQKERNADTDILFYNRNDARPMEPHIVEKMRTKFMRVMTHKCTRINARGHPYGCNEMWYALVEMMRAPKWTSEYYAFYNMEPDCTPLCPDWIAKISAEFRRNAAEGFAAIGHIKDNPIRHLNGAAVYSTDFFNRAGGMDLIGGGASIGYDVNHAKRILPVSADTPLIGGRWGIASITDGALWAYSKGGELATFHGTKDSSVRDAVRRKWLNK